MKLLLKVKNGTPPQRKAALRQLTDKARELGAGPLFNQILPLLVRRRGGKLWGGIEMGLGGRGGHSAWVQSCFVIDLGRFSAPLGCAHMPEKYFSCLLSSAVDRGEHGETDRLKCFLMPSCTLGVFLLSCCSCLLASPPPLPPLLPRAQMQPTLEDQERHLLVKVIDRILYKLDELVRPYVHKILVVIEPLLIDEDYYARVEVRRREEGEVGEGGKGEGGQEWMAREKGGQEGEREGGGTVMPVWRIINVREGERGGSRHFLSRYVALTVSCLLLFPRVSSASLSPLVSC